jgi:hypothetical protein
MSLDVSSFCRSKLVKRVGGDINGQSRVSVDEIDDRRSFSQTMTKAAVRGGQQRLLAGPTT